MGGCHSEDAQGKKRKNKISKQSNTKISMLILNKSDIISNDPEQDSHFFLVEDVWYKDHNRPELLFDPKKFINLYTDYRQLQIHYAQNWENLTIEKPDEEIQENEINLTTKQSFDSQGKKAALNEWRYVIRKGVPLSLIRDLIYCVFNINNSQIQKEYKELKDFVFNQKDQNNILITPSFSQYEQIDKILVNNTLNEKGMLALKRILWCLKDQYFKLQYNPLVINSIALLFFFLNEGETHYCIKSMLENSIEQLNANQTQAMRLLRWHFTLTQEESNKNAKLFIEHCSKRSSDFRNLMCHFEKCGFLKEYKNIFIEESNKIFMDIFKLSTCIRIFTIFLNEGVRVFYKIFYGYTMILRPRLLLTKDNSILKDLFLLSHIDEDIEQLEKLFKMAYTLKIKSNNKDFQHMKLNSMIQQPSLNVYYRPRVKDQSEIINYNSFEFLWQYIPKIHKISDPVLFYTTTKNGYSLKNIYQACKEHLNCQLIMIIKTQNAVFGAFLDTMIDIDKKKDFYGGNETFLFQLAPKQEVYMTNAKIKDGEDINKNHILSTHDYLQLGINDPAITLKDDLSGYSQKCETYLSPPLNNSESDTFSTNILELYYLQF